MPTILLENTIKYRVGTEQEAKDLIEKFREGGVKGGYIIKKASYERKIKKSKGEVIAEVFVVNITEVFDELWGDL